MRHDQAVGCKRDDTTDTQLKAVPPLDVTVQSRPEAEEAPRLHSPPALGGRQYGSTGALSSKLALTLCP